MPKQQFLFEADRIINLLERLEWSSCENDEACCPYCHAREFTERSAWTHREDCELKKVLHGLRNGK